MQRVDPATRRCEHVGTDKTKCASTSGAVGNWDLGTGKHAKFKWLCMGHAIYWGVSRNPQQAVFEKEDAS
jgi:hypothetical protein